MVPYHGNRLTADQQRYNTVHSRQRISVEWSILMVMEKFSRLRGGPWLYSMKSPIAIEFLLAVEFTNLLTCLNGSNRITERYGTRPPTISDYLVMRN